MMTRRRTTPVSVIELFPEIRERGMAMLRELTTDEWSRPTAVPGWNVHDIALHLTGGMLANISRRRDAHPGNFASFRPDGARLDEHDGLVRTLNTWNEAWVVAARRLSPTLTIDLLDMAVAQLEAHFRTQDLMAMGDSIGWAGPDAAPLWLDVARECTELWTHLAQIREATGRETVDTARLFAPVLATFVHGVPHALLALDRPVGAALRITITGESGGEWWVVRDQAGWRLNAGAEANADASVVIDGVDVWRLATKGIGSVAARHLIDVDGDREVAEGFLRLVAILA